MDEALDRLRRKWRTMAPLEMLFTGLGYLAYAIAVGSVLAAVFLLTSIDEKDPGFPAGEGFLKAIKGYGIGLFAVASIVFYYLGRWLLDSRVPGARQTIADRYETSRMATELAANSDFQTAGSWEWRERVAYDVLPQLREYAESEDWEERRLAGQTIKEAWTIYLRQRDGI